MVGHTQEAETVSTGVLKMLGKRVLELFTSVLIHDICPVCGIATLKFLCSSLI